MDIERKAEIAGRVLICVSVPVIILLDLLAAWGMLWLPMSALAIPILAVAHGVVLVRKRTEVWQFLGWGLGPPFLILAGLGVLGMIGVFYRVGA